MDTTRIRDIMTHINKNKGKKQTNLIMQSALTLLAKRAEIVYYI